MTDHEVGELEKSITQIIAEGGVESAPGLIRLMVESNYILPLEAIKEEAAKVYAIRASVFRNPLFVHRRLMGLGRALIPLIK